MREAAFITADAPSLKLAWGPPSPCDRSGSLVSFKNSMLGHFKLKPPRGALAPPARPLLRFLW